MVMGHAGPRRGWRGGGGGGWRGGEGGGGVHIVAEARQRPYIRETMHSALNL